MANRSRAARLANRRPVFGVQPDLMPRETASSFLSRLAYLTGRSVPDMKTETGVDVRSIDLGDEAAIRDLSNKCGMGHGAPARWSPRRRPGKVWHLHGQSMGTDLIDRTFFRFCPACVSEDLDRGGRPGSFMRAEWTVATLRTCPEHEMLLASASPDRVPFAPYDYCSTIAYLEGDIPQMVDEAHRQAPSSLEVYLRDRLFTGTKKTSWIDGLAFHAAAELSEVVGAVALYGKKVRLTSLSPEQRIDAGAGGYELLSEGRAGLRRFLDGLLRDTRTGKGVWGPQEAVGRINDFLDARREDPGYGLAIEYVRDFLMNEVPLEPGEVVLGVPLESRRVWNLRSLAREVRTTVPLLTTILQRNGLMSKTAEFRASRSAFDIAKVRALVETLDDEILTLPGVMRRTGLSRRHVIALMVEGGLVSVTGSAKVHNAQARFAARNVDETMERLHGGEVVDAIPNGMATLVDARHAAICTYSEVLGLVLQGRLSRLAYLAGADGLDAILVSKDEVARLVLRPEPSTGLTRIEVQRRTGLTQRPVQRLFENRIFDLSQRQNPVKRSKEVVATEESVDRFMREHIILNALATHHGVHFRRMKSIMEAAGIEPVFDPDEYQATFYDRRKAEALDLDTVDSGKVVTAQRTRAETQAHRRRIAEATKDARSAAEVLREVERAPSIELANEDVVTGRRWTRQGRSRRLKGEIGRKRVPSRRWLAERQN